MDISLKLVLYQTINFIVLMVILSYLFNKFIRPFMHKRTEEIKKSFEEIEKQKQEMEGLKRDYTDQLKDIKEQAKLQIEKAVEEGNKMRDDIVSAANKESVSLIDRAKTEIEREKRKAIMEIQTEVASLSLMATKKLISKNMDESANRRLVEAFLEDLTKNPPEKI